jgi:5-hydroxyisourate hydrolase
VIEVLMAKLTTHVLDIVHGRPAAGMKVEFFKVEREGQVLLKTVTLNKDGRTDEPLLEGELILGTYELRFFAGDFFAQFGGDTVRPRFIDVVPVRFGIAVPGSNYHVPLLVSKWSYSTYRGS